MPLKVRSTLNDHHRRVMRWLYAASVAFLASGCSPTALEEGFEIQTDSTEYKLRYVSGLYWVDVEVRVSNPLDRTVFLHRQCGYGDNPSSRLHRVHGDTTPIWLDTGVCITRPLRGPIPLGGGETYVDQIQLVSTESPNANPPITMAMRTGKFVLIYDVQLTNAVEGWGPVNPLPPERSRSNPFVVIAP